MRPLSGFRRIFHMAHKYHAHGGIQITYGSLWKNMFFFSVPLMAVSAFAGAF